MCVPQRRTEQSRLLLSVIAQQNQCYNFWQQIHVKTHHGRISPLRLSDQAPHGELYNTSGRTDVETKSVPNVLCELDKVRQMITTTQNMPP